MTKHKISDTLVGTARDHGKKLKLDSENSGVHDKFHLGAGYYVNIAKSSEETVSQHQDRILAAAKRVPRFLFRFWDKDSGGPGIFNTKEAVTPRAFANRSKIDLMFDMQQFDFDWIATDHVAGDDTETVFSSWSQTLSTVIKMALRGDHKTTHICILDTKLLELHNIIISTVTANEICPAVDIYNDEFLIFGIISGPAYQAIPLRKINQIRSYQSIHGTPLCKTWRDCIEDTYKIVHEPKRLRPEFQVPFAAHLLTLHDPKHVGTCVRKRLDQKIPELLESFPDEDLKTLAVDPAIMEPGYANAYGYTQADRAYEAIRNLIVRKFGESEILAMQRAGREANQADETPYEREQRYEAAQKDHESNENDNPAVGPRDDPADDHTATVRSKSASDAHGPRPAEAPPKAATQNKSSLFTTCLKYIGWE